MSQAVEHLSAFEIFAYMCSWLAGVLLNYANKVKREGVGKWEYWTSNPFASIASILVSLGICMTMLTSGEANHVTYFSVAFMAENLINVTPKKQGTNNEQSESNVEVAKRE